MVLLGQLVLGNQKKEIYVTFPFLENGIVDGVFEGCPAWSLPIFLSFDTALMSMTMQHGWAQEIRAAMALRVAQCLETTDKKTLIQYVWNTMDEDSRKCVTNVVLNVLSTN